MVRLAEVAEDRGAAVARHGLDAPDVDAALAEILNSATPERVSTPSGCSRGGLDWESEAGCRMFDGVNNSSLGDRPERGSRKQRKVSWEWDASGGGMPS